MKWALSELNKFRGHQVEISETVDLSQNLKKREPMILEVSPIKVEGNLQVDATGYYAHLTIETVLTLPSSRSLTPVLVPFMIEIHEDYMTQRQYDALQDVSEEEKSLVIVLDKDLIDLNEAIEDYILLNLPLQVLTEEEQNSDELPKGEFWTVLSEDDLKHIESEATNEVDPRLTKLSDFFKSDD